MPRCQFKTDYGVPCTNRAIPIIGYCWQHTSRLIKGIGVDAVIGLILTTIGLVSDLKGLVGWGDPVVETKGVLIPDNAPTPPNPCEDRFKRWGLPIPPDAVKIFVGNVVVYQSKFPIPIVRMADHPLLTINKNQKGISISAEIYSADGRIVAELRNNGFNINPNNYFRRGEPNNKHSLVVYD
jgi:hypothetical protein